MEKLTAQMAENIRNSLRDLVRFNSFTYGYHKIVKPLGVETPSILLPPSARAVGL
jgi:hypothetical protein